MGRTYTSLTYHAIFSTKYRRKIILPSFRNRLYEYIGGIIRKKNGVLIEINGIPDLRLGGNPEIQGELGTIAIAVKARYGPPVAVNNYHGAP